MKYFVMFLALVGFVGITMISAMAQENVCSEIDVEIESSANLIWSVCFIEKDTTLKINTFSEEHTENKIILKKNVFWNYHFDCSPREFDAFLNDKYMHFNEEYFEDYRILYVSLEKGQNEILIGIPTLPPNPANSLCPELDEDDPLPRSLGVLLNNHERPSLKEQLQKNTPFEDLLCKTYMELIVRPDHSGVACVTESTKENLIERGWTKTSSIQIRNPVSTSALPDPMSIMINGNYLPLTIPIKVGETKEIDVLLEPKIPIMSSTIDVESYFGSAGKCDDIDVDSYCPGRGIEMHLSDTLVTSQKELLLTITIPDNMAGGTYSYRINADTLFESPDHDELRTVGKSLRFDLKVENED